MELDERFFIHRVLQQSTQHLPHVLDVFTGSKGIGHPDKVSSACVLLYQANVKPANVKQSTLLPTRSISGFVLSK